MIIIILISIYLLSVLGMWYFIHITHSKGGIWEHLSPNETDLLITLCPLVNTIFCILSWAFLFVEKLDLSKFFNIKK